MELEEGEVDPAELFGPGEDPAAGTAATGAGGAVAAGEPSLAEVAAKATNTTLLPTLDVKPLTTTGLPLDLPTQNICRNFQRGACFRGAQCRYAHPAGLGPVLPVLTPLAAPVLPVPAAIMPFNLDSKRGILPTAQAMDRITADVASWQAGLRELEDLLVRIEKRRGQPQLSEAEQEAAWLAEQQRIMDDLRARNMVMTMTSQRDYLGRDRHLRSRTRPASPPRRSPVRGRRDRTRSRSPVSRGSPRRRRSRSRSRSNDRRPRRTRSRSRSRDRDRFRRSSRSRSRDRGGRERRRSRSRSPRRRRSRTRSPARPVRKASRSRSRSRSPVRSHKRSRSRSNSRGRRSRSRSETPEARKSRERSDDAAESVHVETEEERAEKARLEEELKAINETIARKLAGQANKTG